MKLKPIHTHSLFILLAFALRWPNMGRESLWFDEAISYLTAQFPVNHILDNTIQSSHPPLYYFLLHFWQYLVPHTDAALRLLGVLWNLLLVVFIYLLVDKLFDKRPLALWSAFFVAISPFHILYSPELRMYTQLASVMGRWSSFDLFSLAPFGCFTVHTTLSSISQGMARKCRIKHSVQASLTLFCPILEQTS